MKDDSAARQFAREDILLRYWDQSWEDQHRIYKVITGYFILSGPGSKALREQKERAECVRAVQKVAKYLGLSEKETPGIQEYEQARKEIGIELSSSTIIRRWEVWREVCKAARGERVGENARQRAHRRAAIKHRPKNSEEWLAGVREWLLDGAHSPYKADEYDAWAQERNETKPNLPPVSSAGSIASVLAIPWSTVVKAAKREVSLVVAQRQHLKRLKKEGGEFVGATAIALMFETTESAVRYWSKTTAGFPAVVFRMHGYRVWYLADIEAYKAGQPVQKRKQGELQSQILTFADTCLLCGVTGKDAKRGRFRLGARIPPSDGCIARHPYWFRTGVEAWLEERG